jgi:Concanavalin A-like lectin/glucanases superfamily
VHDGASPPRAQAAPDAGTRPRLTRPARSRPTAPPRRRSIPPTSRSSRALGALIVAAAVALLGSHALASAAPAPHASKGLVAAYGFNEADSKGMRFGDASGLKNGATGRKVRRVEGRFGRGAAFNGRNSWLTVRNRASLNLARAMTLEAWVKPRAVSGRRAIVAKPGARTSVYALHASTPKGAAAQAAMRGRGRHVARAATVPLGRWTHVAATYDGSRLRLYQNGQEVSSEAATGLIRSSGGPLRIGGTSLGGDWFKGVIDEVRIYRRALTGQEIQRDMRRRIVRPKRTPAPAAAAPAPSGPGPFSFGIVTTRGVEHIDDARRLGARITRIHFEIDTPTSSMREFVDRAARQGVEVILLAAFNNGIPSADQARGLAAWAREFGPGGTFWNGRTDGAYAVRYIEFGNETSYSYQGTQDQGGEYALRARDAIEAIRAANPRVGLLVQADDANINPSPWVRDMHAAVPNLGDLAAGWTIHPYGPRSRWEPKISRLIAQTAGVGWPPLPLFMTEWGISTDDGRSLSDNYTWPTNMTYQQAADGVTREIADMNARFPGRLATLLWYFIRDHAAPGSSSDREVYFGAVKQDRSDKGPLTAAIRAALARYPAH